jgi:raffinose/stachyose/melibiose transport system substrate-binding protein
MTPMSGRQLSRRGLLLWAGAGASAVLAAACSSAPAATPTTAPAAAKPADKPAAAPTTAPAAAAPAPAATKPAAAAEAKPAEKPASAAPAASKPGGVTNLVFWYQGTPEQYQEGIKKVVQDEFNEINKGKLELKLEFIADLDRVGRTAIAAGSGPDVTMTNGPSVSIVFAQADQIIPLDDYSAKFRWKQNMFDWAYLSGMYQGKLISLQQSVETLVLWYNKPLFDKNGWKLPQSRDDYFTLGKEMQKASIIPFANPNRWGWYASIIYNHAGGAENVYNALLGKKKWTDTEFVEAMQLFKEMSDAKLHTDGKQVNTQPADAWSLFRGQKAAMKWEGTWALQSLVSPPPDFEWEWAPIGGLSKYQPTNVYTAGSGGAYSIVKTGKNHDAAAEVLDHLYNDRKRAVRLALAQPGEFIAPLRFEDADFPSSLDPRHRRIMKALAQATDEKKYGYLTWANWPTKTQALIGERMADVVLGKLTPAEMQKLVQDQFDEELKANQVPPLAPR